MRARGWQAEGREVGWTWIFRGGGGEEGEGARLAGGNRGRKREEGRLGGRVPWRECRGRDQMGECECE